VRADIPMGASHPSLSAFQLSGTMPGGQEAKAQLKVLATKFTLEKLAYQFSHVKPLEKSKETVLEMGFGQIIQIKLANLAEEGGGLHADLTLNYGSKEVLKAPIQYKTGECVILAGRVDPGLPILSVFTLEVRQFTDQQGTAYQDFLDQARRDAEAMAPPQPTQRAKEPYLPGVGGVSMPELISRQGAVYPDAAKPNQQEGQVIVEVVVDREGKVTSPRVLTPPSMFDSSALDAAVTYRYKPALKDGKPVSVTMNIIIVFKYTVRPGQ
jgi:TonB family protein